MHDGEAKGGCNAYPGKKRRRGAVSGYEGGENSGNMSHGYNKNMRQAQGDGGGGCVTMRIVHVV